jgi:hypothetical protein
MLSFLCLLQWLVFTTMQGSQAFKLHLRNFAIAHRNEYAFGCTADGRPLLSGQRPMVGTVIHDEAHNMTGAHSKPFTRALLVSSQLSARSLSLTATPMEAKERMDAKAAKQRELRQQRREDLKRQKLARQAQRKQAAQQAQNNTSDAEELLAEQQQTSEAAEPPPLDSYASDSDDGLEDGIGGIDSSDDDDLEEDAVRLLDVPNSVRPRDLRRLLVVASTCLCGTCHGAVCRDASTFFHPPQPATHTQCNSITLRPAEICASD